MKKDILQELGYDDLYDRAIDDIEFNIIRAMPYYPEGPRVIMDRDAFKDE